MWLLHREFREQRGLPENSGNPTFAPLLGFEHSTKSLVKWPINGEVQLATGLRCVCDRSRPVRHRIVAGMDTDVRDRHEILLTRRQVEARCRLSASSIYRFMRDGLFPEPIRVGRRAVRWHASEIDAWLAARPRATGDRPSV